MDEVYIIYSIDIDLSCKTSVLENWDGAQKLLTHQRLKVPFQHDNFTNVHFFTLLMQSTRDDDHDFAAT